MARMGLRSRLIGGGGQPQVGFLSGLANSLNTAASQMAQEQDPEVQLKRQLIGLKIQAMQGQQQAQQQEQETMAGFRKLGEDIIPEAGTQVPTEAKGPGAGQVLGTFAGEPTQNDRLLRAMIQSGNPQLLAKAQAQFAPQEESQAGIVEIGGEKYIRQPNGTLVHQQKKEPTYGAAIAERVAEMFGKPVSEATPAELNAARRNITDEKNADSLKQYQQQRSIAIAMSQAGKDEEPMPPTNSYYDRTTGEKLTVPTKGEFKRGRDRIAVLGSKDADNYDLLATAQPNIDMMKRVLPKILQLSGGGGNLTNALELAIRRVGGSDPELAQFDMTRNFLKVMLARVETGGVRPPVILLKLVNDQLPLNRTNLSAAQQEVAIIEQEINNRKGTMIGNKPKALPVISAPSTAVHFGGQTYTRD